MEDVLGAWAQVAPLALFAGGFWYMTAQIRDVRADVMAEVHQLREDIRAWLQVPPNDGAG